MGGGVIEMDNVRKIVIIAAIALAVVLYYVLVLSKHADAVQYFIGG
jgi:hypothetical protein